VIAMSAATPTMTKPFFGSFTIERKLKYSPERVFRAFENPEAKYRWFVSGEGWEIADYTQVFHVGGHEHGHFRPVGFDGMLGNDTWFLEIIPNRRIVNAYTLTMNGKPMSHSLASFEFHPDGTGCRIVMTEQGAYYGGEEDVKNRKLGSEGLLEKLEQEIAAH
jgi:uncharacterized protein YndB with AHSA1/START domain